MKSTTQTAFEDFDHILAQFEDVMGIPASEDWAQALFDRLPAYVDAFRKLRAALPQ